jgi:hypothetical protein
MLFKQLLVAGALQAVLTAAIDVDVNGTPGGRVDRFENNHPKGNRINRTRTHDHNRVNVNVNHQHNSGPTTINADVQTRRANVDVNVDSDGTRKEKFKQNHPKGNRFQDDSDDDSDDEDNVNVDVNRQGGSTTVGGNVQTRRANIDVNVDSDGSRKQKFKNDHPKGNRFQDNSDDESDVEDNVNLDVNRQGGSTTVGGNVQTRNVDINVDSDGSRKQKFKNDHPKGNRFQDDSDDESEDEDNVNVDVNRQGGSTTVGGNVQTRNVDINVDSDGSRKEKFKNDHPKGNRFQDDSDDESDDEDNVNVDVNRQGGSTTVGGNVQTRNIDVNVDSDGSRKEKFKNDHPKGNRFQDDSDDESEDEDNVNLDVNRQGGSTTVGGNVQSRNVDINVESDGSRREKFKNDHPKGNRFEDDSDDEDNVNVNVQQSPHTPTKVGGSIQNREYTHVSQYDDADHVQARDDGSDSYYQEIEKFYNREVARDNVDVDVTPKPNSRLDKWMKEHPSGNRVHDETNVDVNVDHQRQDGETRVGGSIQARGLGNAVFANRCEQDVWIWSVDEGVRSLVD